MTHFSASLQLQISTNITASAPPAANAAAASTYSAVAAITTAHLFCQQPLFHCSHRFFSPWMCHARSSPRCTPDNRSLTSAQTDPITHNAQAAIFQKHIQATHPNVTCNEMPPEHTLIIEGNTRSVSSYSSIFLFTTSSSLLKNCIFWGNDPMTNPFTIANLGDFIDRTSLMLVIVY